MIALGTSALHGRGVFARRRIRAGELIERAPVIVVPAEQLASLDRTVLYDYYFAWGDADDAAIAMGLGSFCNHATWPNAEYVARADERVMDFIALRDIEAGEEVTVHYLGAPGDPSPPPWFAERR